MDQVLYIQRAADVPAEILDPRLYIDVETYGVDPHDALDMLTNRIRLVAVAGETGPAYVFDMYMLLWRDIQHLLRPNREWVGHNLMFDLAAIHRAGVEYPTKCMDTMVGSQVLMNGLDPTHGGHGLQECMKRYCETDIVKEHGADDWAAPVLSPEQIEYSGHDVLHLRPLRANLLERLDSRRLIPTAELEWACIPAITQMALNGIGVDRQMWLERSIDAERRVQELTKDLAAAFPRPEPVQHKVVRVKKDGTPYAADVARNERIDLENESRAWNFASNVQVLQAFKAVGVELPDNKYDTLVEHEHEHAAVTLLLGFKDVEKEATAFGREWLKNLRSEMGPDRVHAKWWQMGTRSGRMSCSDPNLQQLPRGALRKAIIAAPGHVLVRADFSQIEARIAAKISGDETLSNLFINNTGDIHKFTAGRILGKEEHEVTKEDRQIGKSLLFGLLFGMGAVKLRVYCRTNYGVTLSPKQAEVFRDKFFNIFPGLAVWHRRASATCTGKTEFRTMIGRRRIVTDATKKFSKSLNTPVQGTGADLLKITVRELWQDRDQWPDVKLIGLIHDEVINEVPVDQAEAFGQYLRKTMIEVGNTILDPIPVDADVKIGLSWG